VAGDVLDVLRVEHGGHDDPAAPGTRIGPQLPGDLAAVDPGQQYVDDHHVRRLGPRTGQSLFAALRPGHPAAEPAQMAVEQIQDVALVFDDEDVECAAAHGYRP